MPRRWARRSLQPASPRSAGAEEVDAPQANRARSVARYGIKPVPPLAATKRRGTLVWCLAVLSVIILFPLPAGSQQPAQPDRQGAAPLRSINIGFVRFALGPWTARIADGSFDTATGRTIRWFPHDTDSSVVAALSAGRLDVGLVGSGVAASSIARGLDLRIFFVLRSDLESEGLLLSGSQIQRSTDARSLQGKVIAVPFGSTPHLRLLETLRRWGTNPAAMRIVNLQTTQIAEAWKRNEIDAAMVSEPLLSQLKEQGHLAQLPQTPEPKGLAVFTATGEFIAQHGVFLSRLVDIVARSDQTFAAPGKMPDADSAEVRSIAFLTGTDVTSVLAALTRFRAPPLKEQVTSAWLGGGADAGLLPHLRSAIDVWRWAGRLQGPDPDLASVVAPEPAQGAIDFQK